MAGNILKMQFANFDLPVPDRRASGYRANLLI